MDLGNQWMKRGKRQALQVADNLLVDARSDLGLSQFIESPSLSRLKIDHEEKLTWVAAKGPMKTF
jgi:hypothetical protein